MGAPFVASVGVVSGSGQPSPAVGAGLDPSLDKVYPATWYPSADAEAGAETITLAGGESRQADFHLTAIPASHLLIARPDVGVPEPNNGRPRQQAQVSMTRVGSDGSFGQTTFFAMNGPEWDFGGLAPGLYEVRIPGPHGEADAETRQVEVRAGGASVVTLENSKPLTRVAVRLEGIPLVEMGLAVEFVDAETGRRIIATPPRGRRGRGGEEEDGGDDALAGTISAMLPPGRYEVTVNGGSGAYVTGIAATGARLVGRMVEIGGSPAAVSLHLANARGELSGAAKLGGEAASGALVLLVPVTLGQPGEPAPLLRDQTNTDGSFLFQAVVPGRYILVAIDHGWGVNLRDAATLATYLSRGVPVEVKGSEKLRMRIAAMVP